MTRLATLAVAAFSSAAVLAPIINRITEAAAELAVAITA